VVSCRLGDDLDDTTGLLDLLLGQLGDESGLDDERLVDSALAELGTWEKNTTPCQSLWIEQEVAEDEDSQACAC